MTKKILKKRVENQLKEMKHNDYGYLDILTDQSNRTILLLLCYFENNKISINCIKLVLALGVNINQKTIFGYNAAHICAEHANVEAIKLLFKYGIDLTIPAKTAKSVI